MILRTKIILLALIVALCSFSAVFLFLHFYNFVLYGFCVGVTVFKFGELLFGFLKAWLENREFDNCMADAQHRYFDIWRTGR